MLIGFSVSRCLRDIVNGHVSIDDISLIIGATRFEQTDDGIDKIIKGYCSQYEWPEADAEKYRSALSKLIKAGRLYQPRLSGGFAIRARNGEHWGHIVHQPDDMSPATKEAWDNYVLSASLDGSIGKKSSNAFNDDF
jgi:hypothetical protein